MQAIRFNKNEFPEEVLNKYKLQIIGDEIRIYFAAKNPLLPVIYNGQNQFVNWGYKPGQMSLTKNPQISDSQTGRSKITLPKTGFCKIESFEAGKWQWLHPELVTIIASSGLSEGVWFQVRQGIQGVLLESKIGTRHCYVLTRPSTHYFRTMTGAGRMPVLINQIL